MEKTSEKKSSSPHSSVSPMHGKITHQNCTKILNFILSFKRSDNTYFNHFIISAPSTPVKGYIYLLSSIKTAANNFKTNYFDMQLQTSPTECQRVVCYDPQKQNSFKQLEVTNTPVKIQGANYSPNKRNSTQMDLTIKKKAKTSIKATVLDFNIEPNFSNRLINVSDIPSKSTYDVIDLKIKVISKNEEKQKLIVRGSPCFKTDAVVSDDTGTVRLELWENATDEVQRGKSYHLQNLKVKIFDDIK